jgi:hypothetical protein
MRKLTDKGILTLGALNADGHLAQLQEKSKFDFSILIKNGPDNDLERGAAKFSVVTVNDDTAELGIEEGMTLILTFQPQSGDKKQNVVVLQDTS